MDREDGMEIGRGRGLTLDEKRPSRMIHAVLFDLDGTLIDTWNLYIEAYTRALEPHFMRRLSLEELKALRPTSELRLLRRALTPPSMEAAQREFLRQYRELHPVLFGGAYPGVPEMLAALRRMGLLLGIVTGKSRPAWEITARHAKLGSFHVIVTDEDVQEAKPSPEGLALALGRLAIPPAEALYVGDSVGDAGAARAAGVRFAAALWPKAGREATVFLRQVREIAEPLILPSPERLTATLRGRTGTG
jgi:HAD superfamily hydrolase (TIGR01549 family)